MVYPGLRLGRPEGERILHPWGRRTELLSLPLVLEMSIPEGCDTVVASRKTLLFRDLKQGDRKGKGYRWLHWDEADSEGVVPPGTVSYQQK